MRPGWSYPPADAGSRCPVPPYRLLALHAIELYLNAYLLDRGYAAADVRRLQHDLAVRTERAVRAGLVLRVRTLRT